MVKQRHMALSALFVTLGLILVGCSSSPITSEATERLVGSKTFEGKLVPNGDGAASQQVIVCAATVSIYETTTSLPQVFGRLNWNCSRVISARHRVSIQNLDSGNFSSNPPAPSGANPPPTAPITAATAKLETEKIPSLPGEFYCAFADLIPSTPGVRLTFGKIVQYCS